MFRRSKKIVVKKKPLIAAVTAVVVFVGVFAGYRWYQGKKISASVNDAEAVDMVTRGNIEVSITGEASVEPYERYEIISMVSGDIISSPYDVGDTVEEGDVLYQFDTESAQLSIEKQEISLEQSRTNLEEAQSDLADAKSKLNITAPNSGIISGLTIKEGTSVSNNETIAQIDNTSQMEVTVPFSKAQVDKMYVGQSATISSSAHMSSVNGSVSSISTYPAAQEDGSSVYSVTIEFTNPGSFTQGLTVGAEVEGMQSPGYGTVEYSQSGTAKAETAGTVASVNYNNGDYVNAGAVIATISSDSLSSQERSITSSELSLKNAELSMQETLDSLDDYSIKSPISGTVITKNAKAGDTVDRTNSSTTLMVVADISRLKFSMEIDELDISSVNEGQMVEITCDALPGEEFQGSITSVSVEGTATNGVTTYTADVIIDNPGNLRPSMNIDASVIVDSANNVLMVPSADVKTAMGVSYVFLKDETGTKGATEEDFAAAMQNSARKNMEQMQNSNDEAKAETGTVMPENMENVQGEQKFGNQAESASNGSSEQGTGPDRKDMPVNDMEERQDSRGNASNEKENDFSDWEKNDNAQSRLPEAPDGFVVAIVETGLTDDEYIEIKSGLTEGDQVQQLSASVTSSNRMQGMGGMPGGMSGGGGMPGGMSGGGGMPGGGGMGGMR